MAAKKSGLGKGLDSLIPVKEEPKKVETNVEASTNGDLMLDITLVEPDRDQPRKTFNEDALLELSESIKKHGVLAPLLVQKKVDEKGKTYYKIIAGERRWRASKMAAIKEVPVRVLPDELTEQEIAVLSLLENIQREDLNPIEEAFAYKRLIDEFNLKQDEVAEQVSKSRTAITNSMRLLKLDERVQEMVIEGIISTGHARALLAISDKDKQYDFAQRVLDEKMSVREVEKEVKKLSQDKDTAKKEKGEIDPKLLIIYKDLEEKLKVTMGTKVSINPKDNKKGKLEIEYYSQDELDRLVNLIQSIQN